MGTWDIGFFDNDMAGDWENGIVDNRSLSYIESAITPVLLDTEDSLDIDISNKALAASEGLAQLLRGDGVSTSYTENIDAWAKEFSEEVPEELISKALEAIKIIESTDSELKQYWKLRGELDNWKTNIENLKSRLSSTNE